MKKRAKKLELAKETVRGLTVGLERAAGAYPTQTLDSYGCASYDYICEVPVTTYPTCVN